MNIKKISGKLDFDVEAQCRHGESYYKGGCKADCKKTRYVNSGWHLIKFFRCDKQTYYTCSMTCWW